MGKNDHVVAADPVKVEFGVDEFMSNAREYAEHRKIIDAIAAGISKTTGGYESFEDAMAIVGRVWDKLVEQTENGGTYTPPKEAGFGSNNGADVALTLTGSAVSTSAIRKAFNAVGKNQK